MKVLKKIMLIFAAGALFAACSEEIETVDPNGSFDEGTTIPPTTLSLSVPVMGQPSISLTPASTRGEGEEAVSLSLGEVGTRAGDTSATDAECAVKNLWILQFDGNGKLAFKEIITAGLDGITAKNPQTSLAVALKGYDACTVYAIANVGSSKFADAAIGTYALSTLESENYGVSATLIDDINTSGLPMSASWTGQTKDPSAYTEANPAPKFEMKRMVAKVSFTCNVECEISGHSFTLESIQLRSVPSTTTYKAGATGTPATTATFVDYKIKSPATAGTPCVWYMPENLRGKGSNTASGATAAGKGESVAPTRSTYVEVKGKYSTGSETSDITFRIFPGGDDTNDFNIKRNCKYTMTATIVGISETDSRVIIAVDLCKNPWSASEEEFANCYMVSKAGCTYKFNAQKAATGNSLEAPKSVKVLWETSGTNKIIKSVELKSDGWVYFTTAGESGAAVTEGNAVIAVYDTDTAGDHTNVLWSWHIWSTSYDQTTDDSRYTANGYKFLKYNLGADCTSAEGTVGRFGLYYQWGRKDPFIGVDPSKGISFGNQTTFSANTATTYPNNVWTTIAATQSIDFAKKHPTTFITSTASPYDWTTKNDNLWGTGWNATGSTGGYNGNKGVKSVYDPCPPGYRVPPQDAWSNLSTTSGVFNWNTTTLGRKGTGTAQNFYPAAGYRYCANGGGLCNVGSSGYYWSSSPYSSSSTGAGSLSFNSSGVNPQGNSGRAHGFSVRCVQNF